MEHIDHIFQFDGVLHWCISLSLIGFLVGIAWVTVRVLIPLRRLAKQASHVLEGDFSAFDKPVRGINEVEQLQRSLRFMIGQIKTAQEREFAYRNALTESQENERLRVAREIHDDTIQSLVVVAHSIERAAVQSSLDTNGISAHLKNARNQLMLTIDGLRKIIANLRPTVLDELGLVTAIGVLCEEQANLEFEVIGDAYEIDRTLELAIFRAAQEAVRNAEHHAHAKQIKATLTYTEATIILEVSDDGAGFRVPKQLQEFATGGHYGLMGMRERIAHLGGQLQLASEPTKGTRIIVTVPRLQQRPALLAA